MFFFWAAGLKCHVTTVAGEEVEESFVERGKLVMLFHITAEGTLLLDLLQEHLL